MAWINLNPLNAQPKIYMSNSFQKAQKGEGRLYKLVYSYDNILLILALVSKNNTTGSHSEVQDRITQSVQPFIIHK